MIQHAIVGITSLVCILLYFLFIKNRYGYLFARNNQIEIIEKELKNTNITKSKRAQKRKKINKIRSEINKKSPENSEKSKREFLLIWCYFSLMLINLVYLLLKKYVIIDIYDKYDNFDIHSLIIVIFMVISSLVMRLLLKDKKTEPLRTRYLITEEVAFEMTCSYIIASLAIIISLLIMERYSTAYNWVLILVGRFVWFDSYNIFDLDKQKLKSIILNKKFIMIALSAVTLYIITVISLTYNLNNIALIMMTLGITLFVMGVITIILSLILLRKERSTIK